MDYPKYHQAWAMREGAYNATNFITEYTTIKEFEDYCKENNYYNWGYGGRIGWTVLECAIHKDNIELSRYIASKGGKDVINTIGAGIPLIMARNNIELVRYFIRLGANVDLYILKKFITNLMDKEEKNDIDGRKDGAELIKLLIINGALNNDEIYTQTHIGYELQEHKLNENENIMKLYILNEIEKDKKNRYEIISLLHEIGIPPEVTRIIFSFNKYKVI